MHPLLPDEYRLWHHQTGRLLGAPGFLELQGKQTDAIMRSTGLENVLYSFGIAHPGAITLHNYPRSLQEFERENGERVDLSVVDLVRERHRGIPRYNAFREGLHKPRLKRFEDITEGPETVRKLREVYGDIDRIDAMVGLLAETPPRGFGFSDTAFRIFILMASRRLQSDRFLNVDYRPEVYSPLGIDWVEKNTMKSIILRHCPQLAAFLPRSQSAFAPWRALPVHSDT
jgi:Animal haem peroxidase